MAYCPTCGVEYREGYTTCADCDTALSAEAPKNGAAPQDWVEVYTGRGVLLDMAEDDLTRRGLTVTRMPYQDLGGREVGIFGTQEASLYRLMVPGEEYAARAEEIAAGIAQSVNAPPEDPAAMAEAEQDYDVRGCPTCRRYFHSSFSVCPCDGTALLPAVEVFANEQLEPGEVIVKDGPRAELGEPCARLLSAGFTATIIHPGDCATALLCIPWEELTARTEAAITAIG